MSDVIDVLVPGSDERVATRTRRTAGYTLATVALVALRPRRLWKLAALGGGALAFALRAAPVLSAALRFARTRRPRAASR